MLRGKAWEYYICIQRPTWVYIKHHSFCMGGSGSTLSVHGYDIHTGILYIKLVLESLHSCDPFLRSCTGSR
jgi:hypothetical protein